MTGAANVFARFLAGRQLDTPRLRLRLLQPADAPALYRILADPAVSRWIYFIARPYTLDHAESWCARARGGAESGQELLFAAVEKSSGMMIGNAGLHLLDHGASGEIGYWLGARHHGQGLATEIAAALVRLGAECAGLATLTATAAPDNVSSVRVLEKNGFTRTGAIDVTAADGSRRHSDVFSRRLEAALA